MAANKQNRRSFLRTAAGAAAVAGVAPWVWVPNKSFAAATPAFGTVDHVLILYAGGGLRSVPLFGADASFPNNPFGQVTSPAPGTEWGVGSILGTQPIDLFNLGETLPPVSQISNEIAVIAGVDHEPTSANAQIDHFSGDLALTGGTIDSEAGLLSMVHRFHPGYISGSFVLPPFDVGLTTFGRGTGDYAAFRPIAVTSADDFTGKSGNGGEFQKAQWAVELRNEFDEPFIARRAPHVRPYLEAAKDAKQNSRAFTAALHDPSLDLRGAPEATKGGFTNNEILEVLGGEFFGSSTWALEVAFALRLFQFGVPMVTAMRYLFDSHSDEKTLLPMDGGDIGRQLAGLNFLLKRMTNEQGQTLWDRTLVVVASEFARDNVLQNTGFNSADGSDHQGSNGSRNQCWALMGGPIVGGRKVGGLNPDTLATTNGPAKSVRSVWSTVLDVMGIDHSALWTDAPIAELVTP